MEKAAWENGGYPWCRDRTVGLFQRHSSAASGDKLLLEQHPELLRRFVFLQIVAPSRSHIPAYRKIEDEVENPVEEINFRWKERNWQPIVFLKEHHGPVDMMALHR